MAGNWRNRDSFGSGDDSEEEVVIARPRRQLRRISSSSSSSDGEGEESFATARSANRSRAEASIEVEEKEEGSSFVLVPDSLDATQLLLTPTSETSSEILIEATPTTEDDNDDGAHREQIIVSTPTSSKSSLFSGSSGGQRQMEVLPPAGSPRRNDRSQQSSTSPPPYEVKKPNGHSGGSKPDHAKVTKERKINGIMTSTPLVSGGSKSMSSDFRNLNVTAIPGKPQFNMSLEAILDESLPNDLQSISPTKSTNWRSNKHRNNNSSDKSAEEEGVVLPPSRRSKKASGHADEELEEIINAGVEKISLGGNKTFNFKKTGMDYAGAAGGATCSNFFDEEEEGDDDSGNISANFDLDDVEEVDPDIQVVYHQKHSIHQQVAGKRQQQENVSGASSSSDDLQILTEKLHNLPLGKKASQIEQPRKAIFLNEPPPIERKTYAYDPLNSKHEQFYGDVRRTVTMLANSIEAMPMPDDGEDSDQCMPRGLVPLYDHQKYGLRWLTWRESQFPGGGILADEMGLGKTIMVIGLIMKSKMGGLGGQNENWVSQDIGNCIPSQTTLVVCPMGCLLQWSEEISSKGKGLRVTLYHGAQRTKSAAQLAQSDVVITTYGTIGSEIPKDKDRRMGSSPLKRIYWKRIVLDEAHNIRNPKTVSALAVHQLAARHRWAVTGTPVHNRPEDFYSIVKFLRMVPFDEQKVWDFWIGLKKLKNSEQARQRLHTIAKALILRRTKDEVHKAGGNVRPIPPKTVEIIKIDLPEEEDQVYQHLMKYAKQLFTNFLTNKEQREREMQGAAMTYTADRKKKTQMNGDDEAPGDVKFSHLFALIMRLRQCAVLPSLIKTMLEDEDVSEEDSFDENLEDHIISKRNPVFDDLYESAKIKKVLEDLEELRNQANQEERRMDKVVIVSSWTKLLEIINLHLRKRRFSSVFITGKEGSEERRDAQKAFNRSAKPPQIALLSLNAGGVGINLVGGNYVFFVEPHWNPQLELQAQDRVHRFGQEKDVFIRRYITNGSIEDRILELQDMKKDLAEGVLNSNKRAAGGGLSVGQMKLLFEVNR